jgi:two-component system cell cycle response regulator CtrA
MKFLLFEPPANVPSAQTALSFEKDVVERCTDVIDLVHFVETWPYDAIILNVPNFLPYQDRFKKLAISGDHVTFVLSDLLPQEELLVLRSGGIYLNRYNMIEAGREFQSFMLLTVRNIVNLRRNAVPSVKHFGAVKIDFNARRVSVNETKICFTKKEYLIFEMLCLRAGRAFSKENIIDQIYGAREDAPGAKIVDVFICKIRNKLEEAGAGKVIRTIWGTGYIIDLPAPDEVVAEESPRLLAVAT